MKLIKRLAFGVAVTTASLIAADTITKRVDVVRTPNKKGFVVSMNSSNN